MLTLRLTHTADGDGQHRVEAALEENGQRQVAESRFSLQLSTEDRERVRWYLEDYLEYPLDPAPEIAGEVERRMRDIGAELFDGVFGSAGGARDLWATLRQRLPQTRLEVASDVAEATALPWELMRDPVTNRALALGARAFVRAHQQAAVRPRIPGEPVDALRVLMVICRPAGAFDVPFRSVASHLVRISREAREALELHVLRPPTFVQLSQVLRRARDAGEPFHVVHFDGHGAYLGAGAALPAGLSFLSPPQPGQHGYLLFEDPGTANNEQFVDGPAVGRLMVETDVPVLVLNACRSAHADVPTGPELDGAAAGDVHARVRAYGSLAHEVADAGVPGVVAMRYNVWVATAAQFVADLYAALLDGRELGAAVTWGRIQLEAQPNRTIAFDPQPLQDWMVPVVYEAAPMALFAVEQRGSVPHIQLDQSEASKERGRLDPALPGRPDVQFHGRDETLLALDRAFDTQSTVLLHAFAGGGKTTTAVEFARWYGHTGGLGDGGLIVFSSFEQHVRPARLIDQVGAAFEDVLIANDIEWLAHDEADQRRLAIQLLEHVPVLWIWDNVEPVAGFPAGTPSEWPEEEQSALRTLLRDLAATRCKVLLTSRREERGWLGDLPARVELPAMPLRDGVQLARAIVERHPPHRLTDVEDWRPLLRYAAGNPLTITVLVGQALRDGLTSRAQIEGFVARLREGQVAVEDDERLGRSGSLAASLGYGFERAFTPQERERLAVLHLFQGFVDVDALTVLLEGQREDEDLAPLRERRDELAALLDRAAEIGLLEAHGDGYYAIHPALPWYFSQLFESAYPGGVLASGEAASHAFARAAAWSATYWHSEHAEGRGAGPALAAEEANLLRGRELGRANGWWSLVVDCMQGLRALYEDTGRVAYWAQLVEDLVPDVVDPTTQGAREGREFEWSIVSGYRVSLAMRTRGWHFARGLQEMIVAYMRENADDALGRDVAELDWVEFNSVRSYAIALNVLGTISRELEDEGCITHFTTALELARRIRDTRVESIVAFNLGQAYQGLAGLRDLEEAERWYRRDLELSPPEDALGRGRTIGQIASLLHERYIDERDAGAPEAALIARRQAAIDAFHEALRLVPEAAVYDRGVAHTALGDIQSEAGQLEPALANYREAIRCNEVRGDALGAAEARISMAVTLALAGRRDDALHYSRAASRGLDAASVSGSAVDLARERIAEIESKL